MTEKDYAGELVADFCEILDKHINISKEVNFLHWYVAKELAIVHINKMIQYENIILEFFGPDDSGYEPRFLKTVKQEIEKL